ncbi:MAG: cytoplasmic protein [Verrucomicrobia bacterium]|nr:cytoplasmic protein [Verrucomicrobiota bacterium]
MEIKVLLVGESWVTTSTHLKGFDFFSSTHYATGGDFLIRALSSAGIQVKHQPSHEAARSFPLTLDELQTHDVIILSDIGANTLLLPPEVFLEGKRVPNRLELIKHYVEEGGGLVMAGGYLSFQGIYGSARYHRTQIEEVLPVSLLPIDDRIEKPEGINPWVIKKDHTILEGLNQEWPYLLGFNEVKAKPDAETLVTAGEHPLLVTGTFGKGRSVAWTSDIGPHWCPKDFVDWSGYSQLWQSIIAWVGKKH